MDNEISALIFVNGTWVKFHRSRVKGAESGAEFAGRYLCDIEDRIRKELGLKRMSPIPSGIRWMLWRNNGHTFGRFTICGSPEVIETVSGTQPARRVVSGYVYAGDVIIGTEDIKVPITSDRTRNIPLPPSVRAWEIVTVADAVRVMAALPTTS